MNARFQTYEQYNAKQDIGSTRLRVHNLLKHWPEAGLYKYGENPDVLIFQKVYVTYDYKFPLHFKGLKILDICDPDWKDSPDIFIKETLDAMDGVVTSSQAMADYLQSMTKTPVKLIKDRFELSEFPKPKVHSGPIKKAIWFGYSQNVFSLRFAIRSLEQREISLTILSNDDPMAYRWADSKDYEKLYRYVKYEHPPYEEIQKHDVTVFPIGNRPFDNFKSENKTIISQLCGVPVAQDANQLDKLNDPAERNKIDYAKLREDYDVKLSVKEYQDFINELTSKS